MPTVLLDTTDLAEAEEVLSANFSRVRLANRAGAAITQTRITRSNVGSMTIDAASFSYDVTYALDPLDKIGVCRVYSGAVLAQQPGHQRNVFEEGQVAALGAIEGQPIFGADHRAHHVALSIDRDLLTEVAAGPSLRDGEPVRLTGQPAVSPEANRHLVEVIDHICKSAAANPQAAESTLVAGAMQQYLAAAMLTTFPNTAQLEPTAEDRHDSTPVLLRRAIAFIEENAHNDISLAGIAAAVYVTPRALQYMFRKHRDCTPMEYVRRVRLHHAHLDLAAADHAETTVGQIACRWGFGHVGRFSVYYRKNYGQSPHVTLRLGARAQR